MMFYRNKAFTLALSAVVTLTIGMVPLSAFASMESALRIARQAAEGLKNNGFKLKYADGKTLGHKRYWAIETQMYRGVEYVVVGAGDEGALDIDIVVFDQSGQVVQRDDVLGQVSALKFIPRRSSTYIVVMVLDDSYQQRGANVVALIGYR